MVSGARIDGGAQVLSAGVRRTIQSIKEIVVNHSDADIYVALKEANMDPNETTQKLLNQDPFHEVKRRRDRKKENPVQNSFIPVEPKKNNDVERMLVKYNTYSDRSPRRGGTTRNAASGGSREFRVVRDNRVNHNSITDSKTGLNSTSTSPGVISSGPMKSGPPSGSGPQAPAVGQHSSQPAKSAADSQTRQTKNAASVGNGRKEMVGEKHFPVPSAISRVQTKANAPQLQSTNSSSSTVVGVYSSSSDPVHVPFLHSRPAANVGAIRREVGVVGSRRQSSENSVKPSSSQVTSLPNTHSARDVQSRESARSFNATSKNDHSNQNVAPDSAIAGPSAGRSFSSNSYGSRPHQLMGHQKAPQPNKEWKPKASVKPSANGPGVIGSPAKTVSPPADNPEDTKKEAADLPHNKSPLNLSKSDNVIIAAHIRVSEADRRRLTFGSLGTEFDTSANLVGVAANDVEELSTDLSGSVPVSSAEASGDEPVTTKESEVADDSVRSSESNSPVSGDLSDLTEKNDSSSPQNLNDYADVGLMPGNSPSYTPESIQQQDTSELPSFSGYDPQMAYDMSYFHPVVDETVNGQGLPSSQEVLGAHAANAVPASTIAMVQQQHQQQQHQQQQLAQMYPHLHVSHFANLMPYRQFMPPVYVPPMHVPGYSNSPAYPHPSNGSSYLLMPGNSSHLTPSGVKYGIQQFKPVPTGSPTGFGNFTSPTGYAINAPGVVASTAGHDDSSRIKYKDSLYIPNPQAETSEIWMNSRDVSGMQSSYYNMPVQSPHPTAYLTSHSGHASFNAAAAAAQSSHMQFPGMYHPSPQPPTMASPHHMSPAIGGNVGVGVAAPAPGAQVGAYQQPQLGHLNWTGNF
ncbi:GBF-interacting protein 1-like isoform X2 [Salvia splendens]|uniref:GBF-interacting protein 1-like isoform X2 n=1 Tax=Salvia splendens TaxID=180675 RepID=UPI001C25A19B|nr:GBF-interacting protein 1-like isoform X2 [Salvia splendens]